MFVQVFRKIPLILICALSLTVYGQKVDLPIESREAYDALRSGLLHRGFAKYDRQLNRFDRRVYTGDTDAVYAPEPYDSVRPLLKTFYRSQDAFYRYEKQGQYAIVINPVLYFLSGSDDSGMIYRNTRGAEIFGNIGGNKKGIGFYTLFTENQERYPFPYRSLTDSMNFAPNEFFYKPFKKEGAVDFFQARAYLTFDAVADYVRISFGHDKHKIGNGFRSLILSDYAPQFLFLKINTDVGRFHYQNLFTQFTDNGPVLSNVLYGNKYAALHRLSMDITRSLNVGVTEIVVFDRMDSTRMNRFDLNYLNPVIFYRAIESNLGSRDNSMMALDFQLRVKKTLFYGQFMLDEFNLKFIRTEPYWWANKFAFQTGMRMLDVAGIKHLDVLLEYNRARPYTYSHMRPTQSWTHYNQPLAHPLGSNFSEGVMELKYRFGEKIYLQTVLVYAATGRDSFMLGRNYGSNPLRSYDDRATEFDSRLLMGRRTDLLSADVCLSYRLPYRVFVDLRAQYRKFGMSLNRMFSVGIRMHVEPRRFDY